MADDIVKRLRDAEWESVLYELAADEIERLRAKCKELDDGWTNCVLSLRAAHDAMGEWKPAMLAAEAERDRLRAALERIANFDTVDVSLWNAKAMRDIARAALAGDAKPEARCKCGHHAADHRIGNVAKPCQWSGCACETYRAESPASGGPTEWEPVGFGQTRCRHCGVGVLYHSAETLKCPTVQPSATQATEIARVAENMRRIAAGEPVVRSVHYRDDLRWNDGKVIHACEGERAVAFDAGTFLVWTRCQRDVPANASYSNGEPPNCPACAQRDADTTRAGT